MATKIHTSVIASITDLKREPMETVESGQGEPVLILNRNEPVFYCVPIPTFQDMMEHKSANQKKK
jgi:antitoxin StbD